MDSRPCETDAPGDPANGAAPPQAATVTAATGDVEIIRPRNDKRGYRRVVLPNSLECLLISDPDTDKVCYFYRARMDRTGFGGGFWNLVRDFEVANCAFVLQAAASMNVSVGYFCDPDGLEGLAHFLGQCSVSSC
jgi:insulysin